MFIRTGGIPGVGKSTVIAKLLEASISYNLPIEKVKGGDYLLRLAGVETYEELRKLPEKYRASLRPEMYRLMYDEDRRSPEVIRLRDAHFSLLDQESGETVIFPVFPEDKMQMLSMVVLTAEPEVILQRRSLDRNRPDRYFDLETIKREQEIEINTAIAQANEIGTPLYTIDNSEPGLSVYKEFICKAIPEGQIRNSLMEAIFGHKYGIER